MREFSGWERCLPEIRRRRVDLPEPVLFEIDFNSERTYII